MTVEKIIKAKGTYAPTVSPDANISDVISTLEADDTGALVVSADGQRIDGIISERDVVRGLEKFGASVLTHSVRDLMTKNVITCTVDDPVAGIMAIMNDKKIRHVPVVDDGKLAGIVGIRDIIKLRLDEVQKDADHMRSYITKS